MQGGAGGPGGPEAAAESTAARTPPLTRRTVLGTIAVTIAASFPPSRMAWAGLPKPQGPSEGAPEEGDSEIRQVTTEEFP